MERNRLPVSQSSSRRGRERMAAGFQAVPFGGVPAASGGIIRRGRVLPKRRPVVRVV
jgi:hypothetical protein